MIFGDAVLQCEVCGRQIAGKPYRVIIEGAKMSTCGECAKLGSTYWEPQSKSLKQPAEKKTKTIARSVPIKREISVKVPEDLEIEDGFGLHVRRAREKLSLSYEELGRKIGEKVSVIKKIESGKMIPDQKLATKLEHALRIKLFVSRAEPETVFPSSPPRTSVTLGEVVHLKSEKRRSLEDEGNHSSSKRTV